MLGGKEKKSQRKKRREKREERRERNDDEARPEASLFFDLDLFFFLQTPHPLSLSNPKGETTFCFRNTFCFLLHGFGFFETKEDKKGWEEGVSLSPVLFHNFSPSLSLSLSRGGGSLVLFSEFPTSRFSLARSQNLKWKKKKKKKKKKK